MTSQLAAILDGVDAPSLDAWTSWCEAHIRDASVTRYIAEYGGSELDPDGIAIVLPLMLLRALVYLEDVAEDRESLAAEVARLRRVVASMGGEA
jgi:hypothetical protein